jgi:hypothetical protein
MNTNTAQLTEIRQLTTDELDLVAGGGMVSEGVKYLELGVDIVLGTVIGVLNFLTGK